MAETSDGASSWPGLLGQINKTFDLIRDVLGYALPGAIFLAIGVIAKNGDCQHCGGFSLTEVQKVLWAVPFDVPTWALFLGLIAICYAAGNVLAAIIYMPFSLTKYIVWMIARHFGKRAVINTTAANVVIGSTTIGAGQAGSVTAWQARKLPAGVMPSREVINTTAAPIVVGASTIAAGKTASVTNVQAQSLPPGVVINDPGPVEGFWLDWLLNHATEVTATTLEARLQHPELLNTLDRRETLSVMGGSMAAALLIGYCIFYRWQWGFEDVIRWGGLIAVIQFLTGLSHVRRVLYAVHMVKASDPAPDPDFSKLLASLIEAARDALKKLAA